MRILLVVNSAASSVTARGRVVIQKALSADHEVTLAETTRRGNATHLARGAAAAGTDVVVVLGGDGTLNEAANGLAGSGCALATLPGGSTNVFARTLGLPNDPVEAVAVLLDALDREAIRSVGLGSVNGRYFLFHAGLGFDAAVVRQVERRSSLKRYAGHPLFVFAAFTTYFRHFDHKRARFAVHLPDGTEVGGSFAVCLNTDPYTFLGNRPMHVAPEAGLDSRLALLTMRDLRLGTLLTVAASVLRSGHRARHHRQTDFRDDLDAFRVTGHGPFPYQVDGDYLGEASELAFRYEPDVLRLVVP